MLYSNRSGAYASLNKFDEALDDANECIKLNPNFIKGYSRKGAAQEGMGFLDQALETYDAGLKIDPTSDLLLERKTEVQQMMNGPDSSAFQPDGVSQDMQQKILMQMLSNPETSKMFQDPSFMQKFIEVQQNPANIMKYINDPQFLKVWSALSGGKQFSGFGGASQAGNSAPQASQSSKMEEEELPKPKPAEKPAGQSQSKQLSEAEKAKEQGNAAYKSKDFDTAITHYRRAIELEPHNLLFRSNLIAVLIEKKDLDKGIEECNQAIKAYEETDFKERKMVDLAKIYARFARIYEIQEKFDQSIEMYNKSLLENKDPKVELDFRKLKQLKKSKEDQAYLNPELGDQARDRGNKLFADGKFGEALIEYQEAIKRNPKDYKSYNNRSTCYVKLMEFNLAMKEVDKCLEIEPNFMKALVRKASIHHVLKEYHKAIEVSERALKIDPNDESAQEQLKKTRMAIAGDMHKTEGNDDERMRRAMADPEIQQIMMDPMLKIALGKMQEDPRGAASYFNDPNLGPKLQKLIQAGILKVA